mmetsp:Transcript_87925/g.251982  ORF Transcript_87925/g.251982 Transcript_87925/m.251982 type:complete len:241 (+) Transcript_87925:623-1345(+)
MDASAARLAPRPRDLPHEGRGGTAAGGGGGHRLLEDPPKGDEALGDDLQVLTVVAQEEQQGLHGAGAEELLVAHAVHREVGQGADCVLQNVLVLHEGSGHIQKNRYHISLAQQVAVLLATCEVRQGTKRKFRNFPVVVGFARCQSRDNHLANAALAELHPYLGVSRQVANEPATFLHEQRIVTKLLHRSDGFLDEAEAQDVFPVLLVPREASHDAQGGLVQACMAGIRLKHGRQGGDPSG